MSENPDSTKVVGLVPRFKVKIHFEFDIGDRVVIRGSSIEADVIGLMKDRDAEMYEIAWWYSGSRSTAWVFSREIAVKDKGP